MRQPWIAYWQCSGWYMFRLFVALCQCQFNGLSCVYNVSHEFAFSIKLFACTWEVCRIEAPSWIRTATCCVSCCDSSPWLPILVAIVSHLVSVFTLVYRNNCVVFLVVCSSGCSENMLRLGRVLDRVCWRWITTNWANLNLFLFWGDIIFVGWIFFGAIISIALDYIESVCWSRGYARSLSSHAQRTRILVMWHSLWSIHTRCVLLAGCQTMLTSEHVVAHESSLILFVVHWQESLWGTSERRIPKRPRWKKLLIEIVFSFL